MNNSANSREEAVAREPSICAVTYDERFLEMSWIWLQDEELRSLTMSSFFTKEQQRKWFEGLKNRNDYLIWGIEVAGKPVGAFGIKNLDEKSGEYWGYIGEKNYWGQGLGEWIMNKAISRAQSLGLKHLYLKVLQENMRAVNLYLKCGFILRGSEDAILLMERDL